MLAEAEEVPSEAVHFHTEVYSVPPWQFARDQVTVAAVVEEITAPVSPLVRVHEYVYPPLPPEAVAVTGLVLPDGPIGDDPVPFLLIVLALNDTLTLI